MDSWLQRYQNALDMSIINLSMMPLDRIEADYSNVASKQGGNTTKVNIKDLAKKHGRRKKGTVHSRD
jgi:hypothetical protein